MVIEIITIYLITNKVNNKKYVGKTKKLLKNRWYSHTSKRSFCTHLKNSITKYGKENFDMIPVFSVFNENDVAFYEDYFMDVYNTFHPNGYNLIRSLDRGIISEYTRNKLSESLKKAWDNPEYRERGVSYLKTRWTEERKNNQSLKQKEIWKDEELSKKRLIGFDNYIKEKSRKIIGVSRFNGDIIKFNSINQAKNSGYHAEGCLTGKDMYNHDYCWFYDEGLTEEEYKKLAIEKLGKFDDLHFVQIKYIDLKTGEEKIYKNLKEIKHEGIHDFNYVRDVLTGKKEKYHNKKWTKVLVDSIL